MADANKNDLKETKQLIQEAIEKIQDKVSPKALPLIEDALVKIAIEDMTPQEAMGISEEVIEEMYEQGYHLFKSGKFKDALAIFNLLIQFVSGRDPRLTFAIAATHHHMKNYVEAAGYYMLYEALHPTDPMPYYHLYDCFRKMHQPELAMNALQAAHRLAENEPKYADLKGKIEMELRQLQSAEAETKEKKAEVR